MWFDEIDEKISEPKSLSRAAKTREEKEERGLTRRTVHQSSLRRLDTEGLELIGLLHRQHTIRTIVEESRSASNPSD